MNPGWGTATPRILIAGDASGNSTRGVPRGSTVRSRARRSEQIFSSGWMIRRTTGCRSRLAMLSGTPLGSRVSSRATLGIAGYLARAPHARGIERAPVTAGDAAVRWDSAGSPGSAIVTGARRPRSAARAGVRGFMLCIESSGREMVILPGRVREDADGGCASVDRFQVQRAGVRMRPWTRPPSVNH